MFVENELALGLDGLAKIPKYASRRSGVCVHLRPLHHPSAIVPQFPNAVIAASEPVSGLRDGNDAPILDTMRSRGIVLNEGVNRYYDGQKPFRFDVGLSEARKRYTTTNKRCKPPKPCGGDYVASARRKFAQAANGTANKGIALMHRQICES
jgi:hypothetical protein